MAEGALKAMSRATPQAYHQLVCRNAQDGRLLDRSDPIPLTP